eukprot:SAG31_NODE_15807_length_738_cov_0.962441_1_plen_60_part_00
MVTANAAVLILFAHPFAAQAAWFGELAHVEALLAAGATVLTPKTKLDHGAGLAPAGRYY